MRTPRTSRNLLQLEGPGQGSLGARQAETSLRKAPKTVSVGIVRGGSDAQLPGVLSLKLVQDWLLSLLRAVT